MFWDSNGMSLLEACETYENTNTKIMLLQVDDLRDSITKSGTEQQLAKFNKIYEDLKALDLLNNDVSLLSCVIIFLSFPLILLQFIFVH